MPVDEFSGAGDTQILEEPVELLLPCNLDSLPRLSRHVPHLALERTDGALSGAIEKLVVGQGSLSLVSVMLGKIGVDFMQQPIVEMIIENVLEVGCQVHLESAGLDELPKGFLRKRRRPVLNRPAHPIFLRHTRESRQSVEVDLDLRHAAVGQYNPSMRRPGLDADL